MINKVVDNKIFTWLGNKVYSKTLNKSENQKNPFKIAIVIDTAISIPPTNGVTYRLFYLSKKLTEKGHEIIWILGNRNFKDKKSAKILKEVGIKIHLLPEELFYDSEYISKIVQEENVDIVQYEIIQTFIEVGVKVKEVTQIPVVMEMHDIEATLRETLDKDEESPLMNFIQYISGEAADAVVAMTPMDYQTIINEIGTQEEKVFLAPNGLDDSSHINKEINTKDKKIVLLGNMYYLPNQLAMINFAENVLPLLKKEFESVEFKVIGITPPGIVNKYKESVNFVGEIGDREKLKAELVDCTLGLCTVSAGSGMKVKVLDYATVGLPVVSSTIGLSGYEKIEGIVVANSNEEVLEKVSNLLRSESLCTDLGKKISKNVMNVFGWGKIVETLESAYCLALQSTIDSENEFFRPFWLSEGRHSNDVLQEHLIIEK